MKRLKIITLVSTGIVLLLTLASADYNSKVTADQVTDTVAADRAKHLARLRESIKGKEALPADSVFKNIQSMKRVPAGRLLAIMDIGYSRSLGVSCGHCHNTSKFESDEKPQKQIAREMSKLSVVTNENLRAIPGLKSQTPAINCTTCHRGKLKPALNLE